MRTLIVLAVLLTVTMSGCGQAGSAGGPVSTAGPQPGASSGIQGTITVDIGCPNVIATPCPRRPLRARLLIRPAGSAGPAVRADSGTDGRYRVPLAPGRYIIQPRNINGAPVPTAFPVSVTVHPGTWTTLPIDFDSGIR